MTKELLEQIIKEICAKKDEHYLDGYDIDKIPTLEKNVYRIATPMLQTRFKLLDHLIDATHGDWLSISEMEMLWDDSISDHRIQQIKNIFLSHINNWENNAGSLFKADRLSLFAGSAYSNEHIYLLWLDGYDEPELWVYDANGEARYKNLDEYLISYIKDDLSQYDKKWIL
ncbi:hypothetical protein [Pasteurella sp. PK-2025]|uniref:hypothetical protein n=1 Tax=unclassified Pasteurella TaxID=2621516 RepID=UPI003C763CC6